MWRREAGAEDAVAIPTLMPIWVEPMGADPGYLRTYQYVQIHVGDAFPWAEPVRKPLASEGPIVALPRALSAERTHVPHGTFLLLVMESFAVVSLARRWRRGGGVES